MESLASVDILAKKTTDNYRCLSVVLVLDILIFAIDIHEQEPRLGRKSKLGNSSLIT
jgi:hypothetical protein